MSQPEILAFLAAIWPHDLIDCPKIRIGGDGDGGYVLPAIALLCERLLSVGIGNNMQFDLELASFGLKVLQLDHTIMVPPAFHRNCHFLRFGLGRTSRENLLAFSDILTIFDKVGQGESVLKFDIEGAEYDAFSDVPASTLSGFDVIVCEYHDLHNLPERDFLMKALAVVRKFAEHHVAVHIHPNNYRAIHIIHGIPVPEVVEVTYIHRKFANTGALSLGPIPGELDVPNDPNGADLPYPATGEKRSALIEALRTASVNPPAG